MREIKFRVWDNIRNVIRPKTALAFNKEGALLFDYETLMQYTGLKDKNDVEIYESDIIKAIWSKDCDEYIANEEWIGDIFFNYGSFDINGEWCVSLNCFNGTLEVIGNIYENPELLN